MSSKVQICNLALGRLGASRITSLTDNTAEAKLCNLFFDDVAEEVMLEGPWTSTIQRATLNRTVNTPVFEYSYEYQLPTSPKLLKALAINEETPGNYAYKIEGDKLVTDLSSVKLLYIARLDDTEAYDPMLKRAITSRLTAELAYAITGSASLAEKWQKKYEQDVMDGLAIDGQQGSKEFLITPDLTDVR